MWHYDETCMNTQHTGLPPPIFLSFFFFFYFTFLLMTCTDEPFLYTYFVQKVILQTEVKYFLVLKFSSVTTKVEDKVSNFSFEHCGLITSKK
jgi:hypothetical protein